MALKPVGENELASLFNEIERVTDLYAKTGKPEDLSDRWVRAVILKNIPDKTAKDLAMDLRKASSADDMQSIINIYMHDHRTGLQRGIPGPMICATTEEANKEDTQTKATTPDQRREQTADKTDAADPSLNAASKGGKRGKERQRKGYGQCWECGGYGP